MWVRFPAAAGAVTLLMPMRDKVEKPEDAVPEWLASVVFPEEADTSNVTELRKAA